MKNPVGSLMKFIGKRKDRMDIYFLGHYIEGTGECLEIWDKFSDNIRESVEDTLFERSKKEFETFTFINYFRGGEFFHSVGKFQVKTDGEKIFALDEYIFYPWCGNIDHGNGCDCKNKHWGQAVIFHKNFQKEIPKIFRRGIDFFNVIRIFIYWSVIEVQVNDKLFEKLGKPFWSHKELDKIGGYCE